MRVKVREELDVTAPINLRRLSPVMKIYAGFLTMWYNTSFYKTGLHKRQEDENIRMMQRDENLKDLLLAQIYNELINNRTLNERGEECSVVYLSVDSKYRKSLERVIHHKDFLPYDVEIVQENSDLRLAFHDMPYLLKVSKKIVKG